MLWVMQNTWKPTKRLCTNCGQVIIGYRNDKGLVKLQMRACNGKQKNEPTARADRYYSSAGRIH